MLPRTVASEPATAEVVIGFANGTYFLVVDGDTPYQGMKVTLNPVQYVMQPDYWEIEVVACASGHALPVIGHYHEVLLLTPYRGKKGVEVVWADERCRIDVPLKAES